MALIVIGQSEVHHTVVARLAEAGLLRIPGTIAQAVQRGMGAARREAVDRPGRAEVAEVLKDDRELRDIAISAEPESRKQFEQNS